MMPSTLLLALPFAGGNSYSYSFLKLRLPPGVYFETLEYPGRGKSAREPLVNRMDNLLAVLRTQYRELVQRIKPDRVVLYGHSIGAVIGVALLHSFTNERDMPVPAKAIFSGHGGPQITPRMQLSDLSTNELIAYFKSIGSMPDEVALHPELIDYILPILRNDLQLYESYVSVYVEKLKIPLLIVNGNQDNISEENISGWERETTGDVKFVELEGDHFFMRQYPDTFAGLLAAFLQQERCTSAVKSGGEAVPY